MVPTRFAVKPTIVPPRTKVSGEPKADLLHMQAKNENIAHESLVWTTKTGTVCKHEVPMPEHDVPMADVHEDDDVGQDEHEA